MRERAHIITGLQNSCPNNIVLLETDLWPLSDRRNSNLVKYYNKLLSNNFGNQTSAFLKCWSNNQRAKKNSPYSLYISENLIFNSVEPHHLYYCINPSVGFSGVFFHPTLSAHVHKTSYPPEYLRQLPLKLINSNIPDNAILVYMDGSRNEISYSSSGIHKRAQDNSQQFNLRNPNGCFAFLSELIDTDSALNMILSFPNSGSIQILMDSHSAILQLSNWHTVGDNTGVAILEKLKHLSLTLQGKLCPFSRVLSNYKTMNAINNNRENLFGNVTDMKFI
ncbi:uncharacterized protein NPIL_426491 [Nephila pilipes]|uniref:RNase H type-1 domain-containing protein n=1 Tax=Nephila pilipes TaxID=299642 RepID=A0A8X6UCP9_NEPPI|nr:uncharacterized protein NPIL_426491 [Nephila pilipes]